MSSQDTQAFRGLLQSSYSEVAPSIIDQIVSFREEVLDENQRQNLTRLTTPQDFFEGHVLDAWALNESGLVSYPAMDLGSGVGVPGILCAILGSGPWVLAESEGRKADFLRRAVEKLDLSGVRVFSQRGEQVLGDRSLKVSSVVARAVGPVERIYSWIRPCSTWNTLVLLKGPKWNEEWESFQKSPHRNELKVTNHYEYEVGKGRAEEGYPKKRVIIQLQRVPRGTKNS